MASSIPRGGDHKARLLEVERVLYMRTNERRRMTMWEIVDAVGLPRTMNSARNVRGDIAMLRAYGRPIHSVRHKAPEYFWAGRR